MEFQAEIIKGIQSISNGFFDIFFQAFTMLGEQSVLVVLATIIFMGFDKKKGYKLVFTLISGVCLNGLIKSIVKFPRPFDENGVGKYGIIPKRLSTATGYSFPSGHTQSTSTFWSGISFIFKNKILTICSTIIIIVVAVSRLYLGVHWPTDVLFGAMFGVIWAFIFTKLFDYIHDNKKYNILLLIAIVYSLLALIMGDKDFNSSAGMFLGLTIGYIIETKYINFSINMPLVNKILMSAFLILGLLAIRFAFKLILVPLSLYNVPKIAFIRYFVLGLWSFTAMPALSKKLNYIC